MKYKHLKCNEQKNIIYNEIEQHDQKALKWQLLMVLQTPQRKSNKNETRQQMRQLKIMISHGLHIKFSNFENQ